MFLKGIKFIIPEARECIILVPNSTQSGMKDTGERKSYLILPDNAVTIIGGKRRGDSLPQPARIKWPRVDIFRFP